MFTCCAAAAAAAGVEVAAPAPAAVGLGVRTKYVVAQGRHQSASGFARSVWSQHVEVPDLGRGFTSNLRASTAETTGRL
jgi:hypothetical protein